MDGRSIIIIIIVSYLTDGINSKSRFSEVVDSSVQYIVRLVFFVCMHVSIQSINMNEYYAINQYAYRYLSNQINPTTYVLFFATCYIFLPPVTRIVSPFTYENQGLATPTIALAASSALPGRLNGISA